jgi:hypothetical protein
MNRITLLLEYSGEAAVQQQCSNPFESNRTLVFSFSASRAGEDQV